MVRRKGVQFLLVNTIQKLFQEINYIPVSYIRIPFYDDHFDIQNERFLLGKTLYYLGKEMDSVIGRSLQLIGLGLYEKFSKANQLLEQWMTAADGAAVVTEDAVSKTSPLFVSLASDILKLHLGARIVNTPDFR